MLLDSLRIFFLQRRINIVRSRMHRLWDSRGYTDPEVLIVSIDLDMLLNRLHRIQLRRNSYMESRKLVS